MPSLSSARPGADEYAPYYRKYIALLPEGDILDLLASQIQATAALLTSLSEEQAESRYAPEKWSIKEVVGHLADTERILGCRALRIARGDPTPLPSFDENLYVARANFGARSQQDLVAELESVRRATLSLFGSLAGEAWERRGRAADVEVSVRALACIVAGHELHHRQILRTRYLGLGEG